MKIILYVNNYWEGMTWKYENTKRKIISDSEIKCVKNTTEIKTS